MTSKSLVKSAMEWFRGAATAALLHFHIAANPVPASRPRVARFGGVYYGKTYTQFYEAAQKQAVAHKGKPTDKLVAAFIECVVEKPKTGKLPTPRGDVDNYIKGPLDAMTKAGTFWEDDSQVVLAVASKRYAEPGEKVGVNVHYFEIDDNKEGKR